MQRMWRFRRQFIDPMLEKREEPITVYDVGSQDFNGSYKPIFTSPKINYVGLDVTYGKNVDILIGEDESWLEATGKQCDVLISGQCLEHCRAPHMFFKHATNVVKDQGLLFIVVPSRGPYHPYPRECWRILPQGLTVLAELQQLEVIFCGWNYGNVPGQEPIKDSGWGDVCLIARKHQGGYRREASVKNNDVGSRTTNLVGDDEPGKDETNV
jgi:SAM-dependent methyltransferase